MGCGTRGGVHEIIGRHMRHAAVEELGRQARPRKTSIRSSGTPRGLPGKSINRVPQASDLAVDEWAKEEGIAEEELISRIERRADEHIGRRRSAAGGAPTIMPLWSRDRSCCKDRSTMLWREQTWSCSSNLRQGDRIGAAYWPARPASTS